MSLQGKAGMVTGAGSGIGEASAKLLAERGVKVVVSDVNDEAGERVVREITDAGGTAAYFHADVSQEDQAAALIAFTVETFGGLDVAHNNAGLAYLPIPMHQLDTATWRKVLSVDLDGTFFCMRAELAHMVEHGGGAIVNTASGTGLKASPGLDAYVVAKHGVIGLTRNAGLAYADQGIRVNAIAPGTVATPAMRSFPQEQQDIWAHHIPMDRMAEPVEMARLAAFLLSDEASFTTASVFEADGGYMQSSR
jgi:NAD(P)-dependent dehydrogenase (short-subunit alcohol dehydrogenase family)